MPISFLAQVAEKLSGVTDSHAIEAIAVGSMVGLGKIWDHLKGRPRDSTMKHLSASVLGIGKDVREIRDDVTNIKVDVADLRGELRGREQVRAREDRLHRPYTNRSDG